MEVVRSHITSNLLVLGRLSDQIRIAAAIVQIDNHHSLSQAVRYVGIELLGQLKSGDLGG